MLHKATNQRHILYIDIYACKCIYRDINREKTQRANKLSGFWWVSASSVYIQTFKYLHAKLESA